MSLKDLNLQLTYTSLGDNNIKDNLLLPSLKVAKKYCRSVGFFSTSVFETIMDGIVNIVRNEGSIQILASPNLTKEDIETINNAYELREKVILESFKRDLEDALEKISDKNLKIAAELIAEGYLDIKILDILNKKSEIAIYHDKLGIIEDLEGNKICFVGSPNETANGLINNYEKIRVFKDWIEGQKEFVDDEVEEFNSLWENRNTLIETFTFTDAIKESVLKQVESRKSNNRTASNKGKGIELRDYQKEAVEAWVNNNFHGFLVMATGTGKTWTSIFAMKELLKKEKCLTVIAAPYKHLVKQWAEDVNTMYPESMLMYGKEASNRKQEIDRQHYTIPNQRPKDKHCGKI